MRQWNSEAVVFWNQYVILFVEYLLVCDFLSFIDETYCTDMLTFMNRTADLFHNSYCSCWPMKWHAGRFLYCTFNVLFGRLNRLLNVLQCTEILLYSNKWSVLQAHSKVTVLRYPLLLLLIIVIIIIIITIFSAHPQLDCRMTNCVQIPHSNLYTIYTLVHLSLCLTQLFLKWETFQTKFVS